MVSKEQRVAWVCGASSGLGLYTARALHAAGWRVVAGARGFSEKTDEPFTCLALDVTRVESARAFAEEAMRLYGRVDALINCAGYLVLGAAETYLTDELRGVLETNFLGQATMIGLALPIMRAQGCGRVVNFSSINGLMGVPFQGAYAASKHAIEGYSECLAMETRDMGIQVCLVEPGDHRMGGKAYRRRSAAMTEHSPYYQSFLKGTAIIEHDEQNGSDPERLGRRVARALEKKRMPFRLRVAMPSQHMAVWLKRLLPAHLFLRFLHSYYNR